MDLIPVNLDLALFTLRLALGILFLAHGPAKLFNPQKTAQKSELSVYTVTALGLAESLGALSMIFGSWIHLGAILLMITMFTTIYLKTQKKETTFTGDSGWQLEFIILAVALTIFLSGAGNIVAF